MNYELREKPQWLKKLFPWEQHWVTVNGRHMAYIDEGNPEGRPVLLLSGNPTWGFLYRDFIGPLTRAGYRALAPDWIGAGYSDHPRVDSSLTLAHHIADLVSFMDQLELRRFVIVGQDWGGPQGVGAALQRIERLSALVLMNTWLFTGFVGKFHSSPKPWLTWNAPLVGQFLMKRHKVLSHGGPSLLSKRGMTQEEARAYHHVFDEPDSDHVVFDVAPDNSDEGGRPGLAGHDAHSKPSSRTCRKPVLLLWAPGDNVFTIEYAHKMKEYLPHEKVPICLIVQPIFFKMTGGSTWRRLLSTFLTEPQEEIYEVHNTIQGGAL